MGCSIIMEELSSVNPPDVTEGDSFFQSSCLQPFGPNQGSQKTSMPTFLLPPSFSAEIEWFSLMFIVVIVGIIIRVMVLSWRDAALCRAPPLEGSDIVWQLP